MVLDSAAMRVGFYSAAEENTGALIEELELPPPDPVE
jgi:hypothetical protein